MIRRLSNTNHEEPDIAEVTRIIETFTQQLKSSGYARRDARETVVSGFLGWIRKINRRIQERVPFYRSAASTLKTRCKKKIMEKVSWHREKRKREDDTDVGPLRKRIHGERKSEMQSTSVQEKSKEVKTVMFVPYTQGSELAKRLRDAENTLQELTGYKIKIVERTGLKLEEMLHRADPWQGQPCGRERCLLCLTKQRTEKNMTQDWYRRSLVYKTWCVTCLDKDTEDAKIHADGDKKKL